MPDLSALAREAAGRAYAPYSGFQVGAALLTAQGGLFTGCNVENASYGLTVCAERAAICQAVAAEGAGMKVARLAVVCLQREFPPCGACRQVIAEFSLPLGSTEVTLIQNGQPVTLRLADLLPHSFSL
ncbi:MAG: cytidine deaminase [Prosthecobacter sp.]|nr:cytidine deaminase [Prosthecobacter sp.]